jgi:hypothetical protein
MKGTIQDLNVINGIYCHWQFAANDNGGRNYVRANARGCGRRFNLPGGRWMGSGLAANLLSMDVRNLLT